MCPVHLCFAILIMFTMSVTGVLLSITKGNVQYYAFQFSLCNRKFLIALINAKDSHPQVITGRMFPSCTFLLILIFALRLLTMLSILPKAAQPSAIRLLVSGSRSPSRERSGHHRVQADHTRIMTLGFLGFPELLRPAVNFLSCALRDCLWTLSMSFIEVKCLLHRGVLFL